MDIAVEVKGGKMPKYINVDELKEWIENWFEKNAYYHPYSKANNIPIPELYDILERIPTVDIEPVKRGHWKRSKHYPRIIICDECGEPFELSNSMEHWNYCPNCKAKMDEVE